MRWPVKAFPRNLMSGLPLRRTGRSGDSKLTPNQNLLMPDGRWKTWEYMVAIALCNKDTQPSQTCFEVYTFSATALNRDVSLFLGRINYTIYIWRYITLRSTSKQASCKVKGEVLEGDSDTQYLKGIYPSVKRAVAQQWQQEGVVTSRCPLG